MILHIYSVYDKVAEIFHKPFTEINDNTAKRAFENSSVDNLNTTDYDLYILADYDDSNGEILPLQNPERIRSGFDIAAGMATETAETLPEILKKQA